jgi:hypothetical protein
MKKESLNVLVDGLKFFWPRFYNKITWVVVASGLALISAPLWQTLISAWISKAFNLSAYLPNEPAYGVMLVVAGLFYNLGAHVIESRKVASPNWMEKESREHDKVMAAKFLEVAPEAEVMHQLEILGADHSANDARWKVLMDVERFANLTENRFLNPAIQGQVEIFGADCKKLTTFIAQHFFPIAGSGATRTYLYPDLNPDRGGSGTPQEMAKYDSYWSQLLELVNAAIRDYRELRELIKTELMV